jgi:flavin reductase (DIM6/NTAB) family NADH-FMN oxidoreductase RutF
MIANSAQRASLVPNHPRISIYISKTNYSHEAIYTTGILGVHLLRTDQWDLIWHLGLRSARDVEKMGSVDYTATARGCPLLNDCLTAYECQVINAMDAGASTFFLADVISTKRVSEGDVMTSTYFREHISEERKLEYEARLLETLPDLETLSGSVDRTRIWPGATASTQTPAPN